MEEMSRHGWDEKSVKENDYDEAGGMKHTGIGMSYLSFLQRIVG